MRVAWAFLKRDLLIATSYKTAFAMQLLAIFIAVPMFFFFGRLFEGGQSNLLEMYGGNFFAFLLIGMAFLDYLAVSLRTFNQSLRENQLMGTLEIVLLSPTTLAKLLIYSSLYVYALTTVRFLLYLVAGALFGLDLHDANLPAALAILMLSVVSFAAFGIMSASIIMIIKRGGVLNTVVSAASLFLGGVLYPISVLPEWMQTCSDFLPITHGLKGMRLALLSGQSTMSLMPQFLALILFAVILLPLSLLSFKLAVYRTKVTGTLAQY